MPRFGLPVVIAAVAALVLVPSVSVQAADKTVPNNATRVTSSDFADPGFAHFSSGYYLYSTGDRFPAMRADSPEGPYTPLGKAMVSEPGWIADAPGGGHHPWAPSVFQSSDSNGNPLYVMYFTSFRGGSWNANCVGVATSSRPDGGFVPYGGPICALQNDHEAIDPSPFLDPATGKRWIVFKTDIGNVRDFRIQAVQMDTRGGTDLVANTRRTIVADYDDRMEAPSLIVHEGTVWLFLARNDYTNCTYSTDARSTTSFESGSWSAPTTVMSQSSIGLCGPGGATALQDTDGKTYLAFHAYQNHRADSGAREAWVGKLTWGSGVPVLY